MSDSGVLAEWATSLCSHLSQSGTHVLSKEVPRVLAPAVERHLRQLIEGATKVQRRAKRKSLAVDDVNFALSLARQEVRRAGPGGQILFQWLTWGCALPRLASG